MTNSIEPAKNPLIWNNDSLNTKKKSPHFLQNLFVGSLAGVCTISFIQPMIYFKNAEQVKVANKSASVSKRSLFSYRSIEKNPRIWYRGFGGSVACFTPTMAIQASANGVFSKMCDPLLAATAAGILSALIVCPAEGVMIQQQNTGKNFWQTCASIYKKHKSFGFYKAFATTSCREGAFSAACFGLTPSLKEKLMKVDIDDRYAQFIAATAAGTFAAVISHPFDTLKTQQQQNLLVQKSIIKNLLQKGAYSGFGWRLIMVVSATNLMYGLQKKIHSILNKKS